MPRASVDLRRIYRTIGVEHSQQADAWFNGLETAILNLDEMPFRGGKTREDGSLRQILYGERPNRYRIIYFIDEENRLVSVLHIRHGARRPFGRIGYRRK
jgi:plasmid stabilization system protein ParE